MSTDMTKGKPMHLLVDFAVPLMIGNIFQQLYNFIDTIVVGRFIGADALAAVGTTGNIIYIMNSLMIGLGVGTGIVVAQYYGIRNIEKLKQAIATLFQLVLCLTLFMSVFGFLLAPFILRLLQVPDTIVQDSLIYLRICCVGFIGMTFYNGAASILRSIGDSRTPLAAMIVSAIVNIICNLVFVLVFHIGVAGVAYGTVIAQIISAVICIDKLYRSCKRMEIERLEFHFNKTMTLIIVRAGIPSAIQGMLISLGGMSVQGLVNTFGATTMSAYAAVQRVDSVAIQVVVSLGSALSVFTGQNMGKRDFARIREALHKTLLLMMICCSCVAVFVLCFRYQILSIFLNPIEAAESIQIGCGYLTVIGVAYMIAGVMNSYLNLIRGAGDVNASLLAGVAEIIGRIVFAYLLVIPFGVHGIWLATPLSWGCGCIYSVYRYYCGKWKKQWIIQL